MDYLFGDPVAVATDGEGNIYVADEQSLDIRVFSAEGDHLRTIGAEGEGPGEFQSIRAMTINEVGELVVFDFTQRRITRFQPSGEVIETHSTVEDMPDGAPGDPASLEPGPPVGDEPSHVLLDQDSYAMGAGETRVDVEGGELFYAYGPDFEEEMGRFGSDGLLELPDEFAALFGTLHPGTFEVASDGAVWFAPGLYRGTVYHFEMANGRWREAVERDGMARTEEYYTTLDAADFDPGRHLRFQTRVDEEFVGRPHLMSAGLHELADGRLAHFSFYSNDDEGAALALELFDARGRLLGYDTLEEGLSGALTLPLPPIEVAAARGQDRLYVIDRGGAPVVRVMELSYEIGQK